MTRYARKKGKNPPNRRIGKRQLKTKKYKKDLDLIINDLNNNNNNNNNESIDKEIDCDLPSNGQYFCQQCE